MFETAQAVGRLSLTAEFRASFRGAQNKVTPLQTYLTGFRLVTVIPSVSCHPNGA